MPLTGKASNLFETQFTHLLRLQLLSGEAGKTSSEVYQTIGRAWAGVEDAFQATATKIGLSLEEGQSVRDFLQPEVEIAVENLWDELPDAVTFDGKKMHKRYRDMRAYRDKNHSVAAAAKIANRQIQRDPEAIPLESAPAKRVTLAEEPAVGEYDDNDLIDMIMKRAEGNMGPKPVTTSHTLASGNEQAVGVDQRTTVPAALQQACARLTHVGCPDLRVERWSTMLALNMLQRKSSFSEYVDSKRMKDDAKRREAETTARALDLAVADYGANFLLSRSAEVMVRRLMAVIMASRLGDYRLAEHLEELPGDGALAELPETVLQKLNEKMKLTLKIEQLMK